MYVRQHSPQKVRPLHDWPSWLVYTSLSLSRGDGLPSHYCSCLALTQVVKRKFKSRLMLTVADWEGALAYQHETSLEQPTFLLIQLPSSMIQEWNECVCNGYAIPFQTYTDYTGSSHSCILCKHFLVVHDWAVHIWQQLQHNKIIVLSSNSVGLYCFQYIFWKPGSGN